MMMVYWLGKVGITSFLAQDTPILEASGFGRPGLFWGHSPSYEVFLGCEYRGETGRLTWRVRDRRFSGWDFVGTVRLIDAKTMELSGPDPSVAGVYRRVLPRP